MPDRTPARPSGPSLVGRRAVLLGAAAVGLAGCTEAAAPADPTTPPPSTGIPSPSSSTSTTTTATPTPTDHHSPAAAGQPGLPDRPQRARAGGQGARGPAGRGDLVVGAGRRGRGGGGGATGGSGHLGTPGGGLRGRDGAVPRREPRGHVRGDRGAVRRADGDDGVAAGDVRAVDPGRVRGGRPRRGGRRRTADQGTGSVAGDRGVHRDAAAAGPAGARRSSSRCCRTSGSGSLPRRPPTSRPATSARSRCRHCWRSRGTTTST